jgi:Zn-dependent protease
MSFSDLEIKELLKAWVALSVAFAIASRDGSFLAPRLLASSALTVGVGFLIHEMGHKFVAQRLGYPAEFRSFDTMLIAAVLFSFTRFVFALPGAVFVGGSPSPDENGRISVAGPGASILLSSIFLTLAGLFGRTPFGDLLNDGFRINAWWALFNLLPVANLDGRKILRWNKVVYGGMVATAFVFFFVV